VIAVTQPRRSPRGPDRKRDPERTRERLLEAAVVEFGEHGYAGARISAIARRAGVNQQLISYYFDGKEGLFRALQERWRTVSTQAGAPDRSLADVVSEFLTLNVEYRPWARMLVWGALADSGAGPDDDPFFAGMVDDLRRRQAAGEVAADLDPGHLMLLLFGAVLAPTVVPQVARQFIGLDPESPEFREAYAAQLKLVIARLAGPVE
jgi:AcrR family transcriptional regulator